MFKQAIIYYPSDEKALANIWKELASFRRTATIKFVESLNLNDKQVETLFSSIKNDMKPHNLIAGTS
jgi:hypothetical protein